LLILHLSSLLAISAMRFSFVCMVSPSLVRSTFPLPSAHRCQSLRVGSLSHGPLPRYSSTMDRSDSRMAVSAPSPLRIVGEYPVPRGTLRASQVPVMSFRSHTAALDPGREKLILPCRCASCCLPAFQHCRPLRVEYFGAQYLHSRCGLVTPFKRLHHFPLPVMVRCWCQAVGSTLPAPDFNRQEITSFLGALE